MEWWLLYHVGMKCMLCTLFALWRSRPSASVIIYRINFDGMLGLGTYESDEDVEDSKINSDEEPSTIIAQTTQDMHCHNSVIPVLDQSEINNSIDPLLFDLSDKHSTSSGSSTMQVELERNIHTHLDELPPSTSKPANPNTIRKISEYLELKELSGFNLTENIRSNKNFGNPYIFGKAVEHFHIDEIGSNYPKGIFDPHGYLESDFEANIKKRYSNTNISSTAKQTKSIIAIQKIQNLSSQAVQVPIQIQQGQGQQQSSSKVQDLSALVSLLPTANASNVGKGNVPKKRSRWDTTSSVEALGKSNNVSDIAPTTMTANIGVSTSSTSISSVSASVASGSGLLNRIPSVTSMGGGGMNISLPSVIQSRGAGGASAGRFIG